MYYRRFGADVRLDFPETGYFLKLIVLRGQGKLTVGSATVDLAEGATPIVSANTGWSLRCTADYEHVTLKTEARALTRKLEAITGKTAVEPLRIEPVRDAGNPMADTLALYVRSLVNTLNVSTPDAPPPSWWAAQTADGSPVEIRRAEDYAAAQWHEPITPADLAAAAGVSELSLFRSFKRWHGCSPLEFLRASARAAGE
ncbi:MAG: hypothetical protein P8Y71_25220 [Pseudolabrys sp.]